MTAVEAPAASLPHHQVDAVRQLLDLVRDVGALKREVARGVTSDTTLGALGALAMLNRCGPMRVSDLADRLRVDVSVVSRQVASLVARGFVARHPLEQDRRAQQVSITEAGQAEADRVWADILRHAATALRDWSVEDVADLDRLLARLRADLRAIPLHELRNDELPLS